MCKECLEQVSMEGSFGNKGLGQYEMSQNNYMKKGYNAIQNNYEIGGMNNGYFA